MLLSGRSMVKRFFTAVIEKNATLSGRFETEPYEAGWSSEARWFIRVLDLSGDAKFVPQISPDGLFWCDEGTDALQPAGAGMYSIALHHFGGWLRVRGEVTGQPGTAKVMVYLVLKE